MKGFLRLLSTACGLDSVQAQLQAGSHAALADRLHVVITTPLEGVHVKIAEGTLKELTMGPVLLRYPDGTRIPLTVGSNRHMVFRVTLDQSAGNEFQGKTLAADFTVNGVQQKHNP